MQATIQVRRATHDEWLIANPVLAAGEPAFSTDTLETRVGDGVKRWSELQPLQLQNPMYTLYAGLEPNVNDGRWVVGDRRVTTVGAMTTTIFSGGGTSILAANPAIAPNRLINAYSVVNTNGSKLLAMLALGATGSDFSRRQTNADASYSESQCYALPTEIRLRSVTTAAGGAPQTGFGQVSVSPSGVTLAQLTTGGEMQLVLSVDGSVTLKHQKVGADVPIAWNDDSLLTRKYADSRYAQESGGVEVVPFVINPIPWAPKSGRVYVLTIAGNCDMANPTGLVPGGVYRLLVVTQLANSILNFGDLFVWPGGVKPVLSTGLNAIDFFTFVYDGARLYGTHQKGFA